MEYYLIQGYSKEIDSKYNAHLYPNYLTSYNLILGGENFGLQSGFCDALKFINEKEAEIWKLKGEEVFGNKYEFEIVPFDNRIFGRNKLKFIVG